MEFLGFSDRRRNSTLTLLLKRGGNERRMDRIFNLKSNKDKRRSLRKNMTEYEKIFWNKIRYDSLGLRFRRQYGIGNYIADFYCPDLLLVIEIDGGQHLDDEAVEYDKIREEYMLSVGIKTIRFSNKDVKENIDGIMDYLKNIIDKIKITLVSSSFQEED
jgi:very-short-patch-repair endonuclease